MRHLVLSALLLLATLPFIAALPGDPPEVIGGGVPVTMENLPAGPLKERLLALSAPARARGLEWLSGLTVPVNDQDSMRIDNDGGIFYVCDGLTRPADDALPPIELPDMLTPASCTGLGADNVPICHSKTGAARRLYIDFNGATVAGKQWNTTYNGGNPYTALAYDTSGNRAVFTAAEQDAMRRIWARIAEDYAPWDIDVTTQQPADFSESTNPSNLAWLLVTRNTDAGGINMPSSGAGGVAYVDVWGRADYYRYQPAFIYDGNGGGREDILAEAGSHEIGHNLSLSHDGCVASCGGYYGGHGSGPTSWGPLMGTGYNRNVSQWAMGGYTDANNLLQDDVAIFTTKLTRRVDDCGATNPTSCAVTAGANSFTGEGIIEQTTDLDSWAFTMTAGTLAVSVTRYDSPANTNGNNVDLIAGVYNTAGTQIANNAPAGNADASLTGVKLGAGTHYLRVTPDADTASPYPLYGSLGQYSITATWVAAPLLGAVTGSALRAVKSGATNVQLNWTAACSGLATDYAVYEGAIGSWTSHVSSTCTTAGALTRTVTPSAGSRYFLVAPVGSGFEGSYGRTSSGSEIPAATTACFPQSVGGCS